MLSSLFTAITGLQTFQTYLSVISNNIANVNTIGYKGNEANFETLVTQNLRGAAAPTANTGGTDPRQIGLGVQLGGNVPVFTQGNAETTGKPTDFMIQGNGFFVVSGNGAEYYTRNGAFDRDANGNIVNPNTGMLLLGFQAQGNPPTINTNAPLAPINIPSTYASFNVGNDGTVSGITSTGTTVPLGQIALASFPNPSGLIAGGNSLYTPTLNSGTSNATNVAWAFTSGTAVLSSLNQQPTVPSLYVPSSTMPVPNNITISTGGAIPAAALAGLPANSSLQIKFTVANAATVASAPTALINGVANANVVAVMNANGHDIDIQSPAGTVVMTVGIPATALGTNGTGAALTYALNLGTTGGANSTPGNQGLGTITPGALEMSNVDLSREFSNMIIAERGFQANSKTITTSDSVLMTLVNMKGQG